MQAEFRLCFLGTLQIERAGAPLLGLRSRKALAVLGYLAATPQGASRGALAAMFWPGMAEERALNNLSWAIGHLNSRIPGCLNTERSTVRFMAAPLLELDLHTFRELLAQGDQRALEDALALYRGDLMQDFYLDGCPDFELWLLEQRERWRQEAIQALERLLAHERGGSQQALAYTARLLEVDPCREQAHRLMIALLALDGQRAAALAHYEHCRRLLWDELGVAPEEQTLALYERVRDGTLLAEQLAGDLPWVDDAAHSYEEPHTAPLGASSLSVRQTGTALVGRQEQLEQITRLLGVEDCRLLTLVGPGGIGKTRLAQAAAEQLAGSFAQEVYIVGLAPITSRQALVFALAEALKLAFTSDEDPREQLFQALAGAKLLVLDNVEQVEQGASLVLALLNRAPGLRVLATSRRRLQLQAERLIVLEGLELPASAGAHGAETAALQLFAERASQARPGFQLGPTSLPAVQEICRLVEGNPLAIELAASRADQLEPEAILGAMRQSPDALSSSRRDLPERQRSMRAVFASSWELLSQEQQRGLAQLAVFEEGFSPQAAGAVADAGLPLLTALEQHSLLRRTSSGRYRLYGLARPYAREQLATRWPELLQQARARHSAWYLERVAQPQLAGAELGEELEDVRQAWDWAAEQGQLAELKRSLRGLARLFELAGRYQQADQLFQAAEQLLRERIACASQPDPELGELLVRLVLCHVRVLAPLCRLAQAAALLAEIMPLVGGDQSRELEAQAWHARGYLYTLQDDYEQARPWLERSLELARAIPLRWLEAGGLALLAQAATLQGRYAQGEADAQEALRLCRIAGDRAAENEVLSLLGAQAYYQGNYLLAQNHHERALRGWSELGQRYRYACGLHDLACALWPLGEYQRARQLLEDSLELNRQLGMRQGEQLALAGLGRLLLLLGQPQQARAYLLRSLRLARALGLQRLEGSGWTLLGRWACAEQRYQRARRYCLRGSEIAQRQGTPSEQADALGNLGLALLGLEALDEARQAYQRALELRGLGQPHLASQALAGLARVALRADDPAQAMRYAEQLLEQLRRDIPDAGDQPGWVLLSCHHAQRAAGDPRAQDLLALAAAWLERRAAQIDDPALRRSFLEIPEHREIAGLEQRS